jgi:hypothetical protein
MRGWLSDYAESFECNRNDLMYAMSWPRALGFNWACVRVVVDMSCGHGSLMEKSPGKGFVALRNLCLHQMT